MSENRITVVARLISKPEKMEATRQALIALISPTRVEDGCITYELMQNNADQTDFTFIEEWSSDAALDAHLETEHLRAFQRNADDLLAEPPDIRRYSKIA